MLNVLLKKKVDRNENLISFNSEFIAELGEDNYDKFITQINPKIKAKYSGKIIEISEIIEANACGEYDGNIEIKKDSLILIYKLISEEVCTSTAVVKIKYEIRNEKNLEYKIGLRYE